jgi:2-oxoglutarate ferredoxin oxidoreductase subunit beta
MEALSELLRMERLPHIWCPGCGLVIIINCYVEALKELEINLNNVVTISGIGCAGRASGYVNTDAFHTTHGRAIPFATGVSLSKPGLKAVVISGDGDLFAIGGNHFIHAARRNIDMLVICSNNFNYGMTGAQYGPTTPLEARTSTSPYGNIETPFNLVALAASAGATLVSRWTAYHVYMLKDSIKRGLQKKGFSFIEVVSPCTTGYGRINRIPETEMLKQIKEVSVLRDVPPHEATLDLGKEIVVGNFVDVDRPTFNERIEDLRKKAGR